MIHVDMTRRTKLVDGVTLRRGTSITLLLEIVPSARAKELETTIEPSVLLDKAGKKIERLELKIGSVLQWSDLPSPARNKDTWELVRRSILQGTRPDVAFLEIASKDIERNWRIETAVGMSSGVLEFYVRSHKGNLDLMGTACGLRQYAETYFVIDHEFLEKQEALQLEDDD